jgi:X-X-X-Leu-X-X-Gly heptad repeat protein
MRPSLSRGSGQRLKGNIMDKRILVVLAVCWGAGNVWAADAKQPRRTTSGSGSAQVMGGVSQAVGGSARLTSGAVAIPLSVGGAVLSVGGGVCVGVAQDSVHQANTPMQATPVGAPLKITDEVITIAPPNEALRKKPDSQTEPLHDKAL